MAAERDMIYFLDKPIQVVRKFRARRLTLSVRPEKPMRLTVSYTTSSGEILQFLEKNSQWIQKSFEKMKVLADQYQIPKLENGEQFPFLGELKYFSFAQSKRLRPWFAVEDGFLLAYLPQGKTAKDFAPEDLEGILQNFYKQQGIEYLKKRLFFWVEQTGLCPSEMKFNRATTRWGSCNSKKQINLNWKLICYAPHLIDYVIVHELCHLKYMNHSEHFWNLVSFYMPEYKIYEKILDEQTQLGRFLNAR